MDNHEKQSPKLDPEFRALLLELIIAYLDNEQFDFIDFAIIFLNKKRVERLTGYQLAVSSSEESSSEDEHDVLTRRVTVYDTGLEDIEEMSTGSSEGIQVTYKTPQQVSRLMKTLYNIVFFRTLSEDERHAILNIMQKKNVIMGDIVINEGDSGDNFYIIDEGTFQAIQNTENNNKEILKTYVNEGFFGELALLYNVPRACSVIAITDGSLWYLGRHAFRKFVLQSSASKHGKYYEFLSKVPMLKGLTDKERMNLADCLESHVYNAGQRVINQGDIGDGMYFIISGTVRITVKSKSGESEVEVKRISAGDYFGELALLTHKPRAASVYAVDTTHLAFLKVNAFERLLGPCIQIMKRNFSEYETQINNIFNTSIETVRTD